MNESGEQALHRAIATISQADPLTKLLQQVQSGRMKPTDAGLRAVTESWLATYQKVLATGAFTKQALKRIDPMPRVTVLVHAGVVLPDHPAVTALKTSFEEAFTRASE